jgi:phosphoesterase RecJ-like protein
VTPGASGNPDLEAEWGAALKIIGGAQEICLACHVRPDADALGSMLAAAQALGEAFPGRRVIASFGDEPFRIPANLRFLPGVDLLTAPAQYPAQPQAMLTFDAAGPDRLGLLEASAARAAQLIVLDHHAANGGFGTVRLVDPAAAATAVLARELIGRLSVPVSRNIALGLYAGLVTDTGSFKFSTTPGLHYLAAELLSTGIDPAAVARELFDRAPFGYLGLLSAVLHRAVLEPAAAGGRGLVWSTVTRADRERAGGLSLDVAEPVIDTLRRTDEAEVAVVLKEDDHGAWLVSTRSKESVDVGRACQALGGGGHARAAGFTAAGSPAGVMAALRERLEP